MNCQTGWGPRSSTRNMTLRRWLAGGSSKISSVLVLGWWKKPMLYSVSMVSQGGEQCGAQVCAQTHSSGAGSQNYWDHSREDDCSAAGGGENLHAEGDPSPQHGEGTLLNQYVGLLFYGTLWFSVLGDSQVLKPCYVLFPLVTLIDSYESTTFIFLVFDLWVLQQIQCSGPYNKLKMLKLNTLIFMKSLVSIPCFHLQHEARRAVWLPHRKSYLEWEGNQVSSSINTPHQII